SRSCRDRQPGTRGAQPAGYSWGHLPAVGESILFVSSLCQIKLTGKNGARYRCVRMCCGWTASWETAAVKHIECLARPAYVFRPFSSGRQSMRWSTYWIVTVAVVVVGLAMGVTLPLVSLRLDQWGYDAFAIGVMAAMPAIGILLGARLAGRLAGYLGSERCMRLMLISAAISVGLLTVLANYWVWLVLRLVLGGCLTITFIIGESWINQLIEDRLRGRLVAVYGSAFALSQLCGPLLLGALGTTTDAGFWVSIALLLLGTVVLWSADGAPQVDGANASGRGVMEVVRQMPAVAWAVMQFACFEAMALTLLPVYLIREGFAQGLALLMVSTVVVGDAVLQLPIGWLADRMQRTTLYRVCGALLLGSSLS